MSQCVSDCSENLGESIIHLWVENIRDFLVQKMAEADRAGECKWCTIRSQVQKGKGEAYVYVHRYTPPSEYLNKQKIMGGK